MAEQGRVCFRELANVGKWFEKADLANWSTVDRKKEFGKLYEIRGKLTGPNGIQLSVYTIWIIEAETGVSKFVTMYPNKKASTMDLKPTPWSTLSCRASTPAACSLPKSKHRFSFWIPERGWLRWQWEADGFLTVIRSAMPGLLTGNRMPQTWGFLRYSPHWAGTK